MTATPHEPIDVCLTVDVEFAMNQALTNPRRQPIGPEWIYGCGVRGRSEGLGYVLDCLDRHRLQATFFTEAFGAYCFGEEAMHGVVADLLDHGQDVQMHLHPVWLYYRLPEWREELPRLPRPRDIFLDFSPHEIAGWLDDGAGLLARWTGRRPIAFRAGNLAAGRVLYQGMLEAGILLASNVGVALSRPRDSELLWYAGRQQIDGVTEIPVTSYRRPLSHDRLLLLTLTGSALPEMRAVLTRAWRAGVGPIVVLLHPHDLHRVAGVGAEGKPVFQADRLRQGRLERLCAWLAAHPERFRVTTFGAEAARWQAAPNTANTLLDGSLSGFAARVVGNRVLASLPGWR